MSFVHSIYYSCNTTDNDSTAFFMTFRNDSTNVQCIMDIRDIEKISDDFRGTWSIAKAQESDFFQIKDGVAPALGPYCPGALPPGIRTSSNHVVIVFISGRPAPGRGFVAYYEALGSIQNPGAFMGASLIGMQVYPEATAFLSSPLVNIQFGGACLIFYYSVRSNLRVRITRQSHTHTLVNWGVDGGRAFHRANLDLPDGIYKIIWETIELRTVAGRLQSPHNRYRASVSNIAIHPVECHAIGKCSRMLLISQKQDCSRGHILLRCCDAALGIPLSVNRIARLPCLNRFM